MRPNLAGPGDGKKRAAPDQPVMCIKDLKEIMYVDYSNLNDFGAWISLTREVEELFGPWQMKKPSKML
jgi:hypothetical protein